MVGVFVAMFVLVPIATILLGTATGAIGFSLRGPSGRFESFPVYLKSPEGATSLIAGTVLANVAVSVFLARASQAGVAARLALRPSRMTIGDYLIGALARPSDADACGTRIAPALATKLAKVAWPTAAGQWPRVVVG